MPRNLFFQFKQFRIVQERSAMKVGMDGVLLGAWADVSATKQILDVGTGTGLIALMLAQKNTLAQIDAIEIDPPAFEEAKYNVQQSDWADRILVMKIAFQKYVETTKKQYDLIVSNPPFFSNGMKAPGQTRAWARHADALPLTELVSGAKKILSHEGRMALILPAESHAEIESLCNLNKMFIKRLCRVKPNPIKPCSRILIELSMSEKVAQEEALMIEHEQHLNYTDEYKRITSEFYLNF